MALLLYPIPNESRQAVKVCFAFLGGIHKICGAELQEYEWNVLHFVCKCGTIEQVAPAFDP